MLDAAILMIGVPDVLLATSATSWTASLSSIAEAIRGQSGPECCLIFSAIPPMDQFRPIPPLARKLLTLQIRRLDRATQRIATQLPNTRFLPFPDLQNGNGYAEELFPWKSLHKIWAETIAHATANAMEETEKRDLP